MGTKCNDITLKQVFIKLKIKIIKLVKLSVHDVTKNTKFKFKGTPLKTCHLTHKKVFGA